MNAQAYEESFPMPPPAGMRRPGPRPVGEDEQALPAGVDPCSDLGNAHRLVRRHGHEMRFCPELGWLVWNGQRWNQDAAAAARRGQDTAVMCQLEALSHLRVAGASVEAGALAPGDEENEAELKRAKRAQGRADAILKWAKKSQARPRLEAAIAVASNLEEVACSPSDFDRDPDLLAVANGTVHLRTGELRPHRREDMLTRKAPAIYDPKATAPVFEAFLERTFAGSAELKGFVQRAAGYCLTGSTAEQCFFLCYGGGANGKSTLLETLRRLLGDYAANTPADTLLAAYGSRGPENDIARLRGARFVTASESGEGRRLDEERVKRLTGGDTLTARFLHREFFEFVPSFKLWLCTNFKPEVRGTDHGLWRRVRLVPFTVTIPPAEQDGELGAKLAAEASGILRWAVEGAVEWHRTGLCPPTAITDATAEYRAEQDLLGRFVEERCIVAPHATVMAGALFEAFGDWCKATGEQALSQKALGQRLGTDGRFQPERSSRGRLWRGIGLIDNGGS